MIVKKSKRANKFIKQGNIVKEDQSKFVDQ